MQSRSSSPPHRRTNRPRPVASPSPRRTPDESLPLLDTGFDLITTSPARPASGRWRPARSMPGYLIAALGLAVAVAGAWLETTGTRGAGPASGSLGGAGAPALTRAEPVYREYIVTSGDSLSLLARRFLGETRAWPQLYAANTDRLRDPAALPIGTVLRIPVPRGID